VLLSGCSILQRDLLWILIAGAEGGSLPTMIRLVRLRVAQSGIPDESARLRHPFVLSGIG
jgi:hypothetical protein